MTRQLITLTDEMDLAFEEAKAKQKEMGIRPFTKHQWIQACISVAGLMPKTAKVAFTMQTGINGKILKEQRELANKKNKNKK